MFNSLVKKLVLSCFVTVSIQILSALSCLILASHFKRECPFKSGLIKQVLCSVCLSFFFTSCYLVFHASNLPFLSSQLQRHFACGFPLLATHRKCCSKNKFSHLFHAVLKPQCLNIGASKD